MELKGVYIISTGCVYEGGGAIGASLDYKKVRERALEEVEKERRGDLQMYEWEKKGCFEYLVEEPPKWEEENKDYWTNGMDFVSILFMEFI